MLPRRYAVPVGIAAGIFLWWAAAPFQPGSVPVERPRLLARGVPGAAAQKRAPAPQLRPDELPPPEPVLTQSAQRRFSSPAAIGAADGSLPGAALTAASASARPSLSGLNATGGYGAPTAGYNPSYAGRTSPEEQGKDTGSGPDRRADPSPKKADQEKETAPETGARGDEKLTGSAANLVNAARDLKARDDIAAMRAESGVKAGIMRQLALDNKVDTGIRKAISDLQSSGRPVTPEAVARAAAGVLKENGLTPDDVDMQTAIARASGPPPPPVPPAAYDAAVQAIVSAPPLDPAIQVEIQQLADNPPPPRSPVARGAPPRGALDAFKQNQGVFDKAQRDFGVKPEHILGILGVETTWGRNTGKFPLPGTLKAIAKKTGPDGRPTKAALQAGRDLAALVRLSASDNLGGLEPGQIRGSYAGAMGIPQFLPTSWEAYSRAPDGGKRDPFNFGTAAYSVGNYLRAHGYAGDVPRSIWGYNHSSEYVDKVLGLSADVKAGLNAANPPKQ